MVKFSVYLSFLFTIAILVTSLAVWFTQYNDYNETAKIGPKGLGKSESKLVIDHDGGADDAMAIFIASIYEIYFRGPSIVGLTTVNGNVNETQVFENSQRILDIAGRRDIPIYRGSSRSLVTTVESDFYFGYDGLGDNENVVYEEIQAKDTHAAVALTELSKKFPGELTVMAIGPMTNIALAIRLEPEFVGRLAQLYVGAGTVFSEEDDAPEFNAELDVEAYRIVVDSAYKNKVTIVPFSQIKRSLNISNEWRTDVLGAIPTKTMKAQNSFERISLSSSDSWQLLDPAVAAIVLDKRVLNEVRYSENGIHVCGDKRGINTNNFETDEANVKVIYSANDEFYKDFLLKVFSKEIHC